MWFPSSPPYIIIYLKINFKNIRTKRRNKNIKQEKKYLINEQINSPEIRVIDEDGSQLGVLSLKKAISIAEEKDLDLVEVSPLANPPVCRIINFGKLQYQQTKLQNKNKNKRITTKGIRLSLNIGQHDLNVRKKQVYKFLEQSQRVKIELRLRGREKAFKKNAVEVIKKFIQELDIEYKIEQEIKVQGGNITSVISKK